MYSYIVCVLLIIIMTCIRFMCSLIYLYKNRELITDEFNATGF